MHKSKKHIILNNIAFIRHDIYIQVKQNGTHQNTKFRNIQALLNMLQRSHKFRILILSFKICDKEINNLFGSVPYSSDLLIQIRLNFLCLDNLHLVKLLNCIKYTCY